MASKRDRNILGGRELVEPKDLPIDLLTWLAKRDFETTAKVHEALSNGMLVRELGVGSELLADIKRAYSRAKPGGGWGGVRLRSGRPKIEGRTITVKISTKQFEAIERLQRSMSKDPQKLFTFSDVVRRLIDRAK